METEHGPSTDFMSDEEKKTFITRSYFEAKASFLTLSGMHVLIMLVLALFLIYEQNISWPWLVANLIWAISVSLSWYRVNKEYYLATHTLKKNRLSAEVKQPPYSTFMVICAAGIPILMMCQMIEVSYYVVMHQEEISILAFTATLTAFICAVINCLVGYKVKEPED